MADLPTPMELLTKLSTAGAHEAFAIIERDRAHVRAQALEEAAKACRKTIRASHGYDGDREADGAAKCEAAIRFLASRFLAAQPAPSAEPVLTWIQPDARASDYFEAQLPGRAFLDVIESHSGWKCRLWIRDEWTPERLASPVERVALRTADEAKAAAVPMLLEWIRALAAQPPKEGK